MRRRKKALKQIRRVRQRNKRENKGKGISKVPEEKG